jgi:hypothetical protein
MKAVVGDLTKADEAELPECHLHFLGICQHGLDAKICNKILIEKSLFLFQY